MARIGQLLLLIWKNFKLQFRHPWVTVLELGVPAFFSLILVLIRSTISSEYITKPVVYDPFSINSLPSNLTPSANQVWHILYAPETDFTNYVMSKVAANLKIVEESKFLLIQKAGFLLSCQCFRLTLLIKTNQKLIANVLDECQL